MIQPIVYAAVAVLFCLTTFTLFDIYQLFRKQIISAQREMNALFSLNDVNKVSITIQNRSVHKLYLKIIDEMPYQFKERDFSMPLEITGPATQTISYDLVPQIRGEYDFGNLHVFVKTRIGLAAKKETTVCGRQIIVYPSVVQMGRQELAALNHPAFIQGANKNRKMGQSYEFDQVKVYQQGDDTRNINWKASSAASELMVNYYEDERSQQIYSLIDKSRVMKMPFEGMTLLDYAINSTLAFSNIVLKKQDKAGVIIFSKNVSTILKANKGALHLKKIMYGLYKEKYDYSEADYEALYTTIRKNIPNRSLLFLYTNFESIYALERNIRALRLINKYHLLVVVFFENSELDHYSKTEAESLLDIYQLTIARKFVLEKNQIYKELQKHGILAIKCNHENLSTLTINKYLDLKNNGVI